MRRVAVALILTSSATYHASGNGGQFSVFIPDLDLVVAVFGGNYADRGGLVSVTDLIPKWILPAVVK